MPGTPFNTVESGAVDAAGAEVDPSPEPELHAARTSSVVIAKKIVTV
jgi:hypothetical protein